MHNLHEFQNLRAAQAFSDYLHSLGIDNYIEDNQFNFKLFIKHNEQIDKAQLELNEFLQNPNQAKYLAASWHTGSTKQDSSLLAYQHTHLFTNFISHGGLITHCIFIACIIIYTLTTLGLFNPIQSSLAFFTQQPFDYWQSWRFVTPAFLHFSALHIIFNLLWWWQLAGVIEKQQGKQHIILLFLVTAITSNFAQYYLVSPYFGGLSGVVYGLVGYCWLFGVINKNSKVNLPNAYFIFLLVWLALGFIDILPVNVANYAHLIGLLSGGVLAIMTSLIDKKS